MSEYDLREAVARARSDGDRHPIVTSLPPETTLLGMLDAEDAAMFPA